MYILCFSFSSAALAVLYYLIKWALFPVCYCLLYPFVSLFRSIFSHVGIWPFLLIFTWFNNISHENLHGWPVIPSWYFSLGWDFRIVAHPVKGLPDNVEASKNVLGLSTEYTFIDVQKVTVDTVFDGWWKPFN